MLPEKHTRPATGNAWITQVEKICESRGLQLTSLRREVVSILAAEPNPLGAYAIIQRLSELQGRNVAPTTVYRTLDFLVDSGFVVKIESRQTYVACDHLGHDHHHHGVLLICTRCGASEEIVSPEIDRTVREAAAVSGFLTERHVIEVEGMCAQCHAQERTRA